MKSEWKVSTIEQVCNLVTDGAHYSPPSVERGEYMVSVKDFTEYGFDFTACRKISKEDYDKLYEAGCVPQKKDILVGKDGARFFEDIILYKQEEKPALLSSIAILRVDEKQIIPAYLYYYLKTPNIKKDVRDNYGSGSAIPRIVLKDFKRMTVSYPPLPIQRKIASILSSLDDKIETNNAICRNLEELMESMYNKLFVENYNSEWKQGTISDLGRIVGGGTPSKKEPSYYTQQGISWITPKDLSRNTAKFIQRGEVDITQEGLNASGATIMPAGTVLFSSRAPIGYMAIACNDVTTNQGFKSVIPHDFVGSAYLYYFLKANKNAIEMRASGSTFLEVSAGIMRQVPAIIPDKRTLDIFKHFCNPLFEMQRKLETETVSLSQIRETILPKLMSGELEVETLV